MADLHILRVHALGSQAIRKIAFTWAELAEREHGMCCTYQEGDTEDALTFTGPGVRGVMRVCAHQLEIQIELGIFLRGLKSMVEAEIMNQLDAQLSASSPQ